MPRKESFGPVVWQAEGDDRFTARCYAGDVDCVFRIGNVCTHVSPSREIETLPETPDWCEMKAGMLRDAAEMTAGGKPWR